MVTIIDYGIGNLRSIEKALQQVGVQVLRTDDPHAVLDADRLVLPGVGAFGACIDEIRDRGLEQPILDAIDAGTPLLGVCVGMQLLFEVGEEHGEQQGLGVLPGRVVHFNAEAAITDNACVVDDGSAGVVTQPAADAALKVPHMGWNTLEPTRTSPLLDGIDAGDYVYFVHSFHAAPTHADDVLATTTYGHTFPAIVQRETVFGVQFHPEKSQDVGLQLLRNFAHLPRSG